MLDLPADGSPVPHDDRARLAPPPDGTRRWIDVEGEGPDARDLLEVLRQRFGLHPLAIEDCISFDQRPKLEEYDEHLFLVTHAVRLVPDAAGVERAEALEVHAFLGDTWLITVHVERVEALESAWGRVASEPALGRRGVDFLYYLVAAGCVDAVFPVLERLAARLEEVEDVVLHRPRPVDLSRILELKRMLIAVRRIVAPQRDVFAALERREEPQIAPRTRPYFRDVHDHLVRMGEALESSRTQLNDALDAYLTAVSNRTNEIMKRLTILSAIFLPLTFVTGFFGQNFAGLPFDSGVWLGVMLAACLLVPVTMVGFFLWRHWL